MAIATGAVVANLYYAQPLAQTLAVQFHASSGAVGVLITLIQLGYALGLATLVPLGDLVERRRLLIVLLAACAAGLVVMAAAPTLAVIASAAVLVGLTSVAVQVIVPFAAHLAAEGRQGKVVGTVMSGLLIGILVSRTVSGLLAGAVGWRWVFGMAAVVTLGMAGLLWRELPEYRPTVRMSYPALLGSVLVLIRRHSVLRYRMIYGGLGFAAFSAVWSVSGFLLARAPYHWGETRIGLFALLGAAGAVAARFAGSLADRGHAHLSTAGFALVAAVSFVPLWLGGH
jgi:predicted MFS family arabinose efflux permease